MENYVIGLIGIGVLILLFILRVPIAFSMLAVGIVGFSTIMSWKSGLSLLGSDVYFLFSDYGLTAFPMFILAGSFAFVTGMGDRIYAASHWLLGRVPGNLAVSSAAACAGFAAICGSSAATTAAVGKVAYPAMKKAGYDPALSTGIIASAGTLGPLIPPSVVFILYGTLTEESIGKLFIAGVLPGLLLTALLVGAVVLMVLRKPSIAPPSPPPTRQEKINGLIGIAEVVVLFGLMLIGLFFGWFSPTQGGAALAAAILIIAGARKQIKWKPLWDSIKESVQLSCMIILIMAGGFIFSRFMAVSHLQVFLGNWVLTTQLPHAVVMGAIIAGYVILGTALDMMGLTVLTVPIIFPAILALGYDPIWFGVMIVVIGGTATISPPEGVNVYVMKSVAKEVPISTIFRGVWPFLGAMVVCIIILFIFPQIATWLPSFMSY